MNAYIHLSPLASPPLKEFGAVAVAAAAKAHLDSKKTLVRQRPN